MARESQEAVDVMDIGYIPATVEEISKWESGWILHTIDAQNETDILTYHGEPDEATRMELVDHPVA